MKGIVLAGGTGSRLFPLTSAQSKQMLPVFDKPLVYYPISTLMLAGIREILVVTRADQSSGFSSLLSNGRKWGVSIDYAVQDAPRGIAEALLIAEEFLAGSRSALILGDNLFYGPGLGSALADVSNEAEACIFAYEVSDPRSYAVVAIDEDGIPQTLEEKPAVPKSTWAVPGLYFYPPDAPLLARQVGVSDRGELEITDLNRLFLDQGRLSVRPLPRGTVWMDAGTVEGLHDAASFVRVMEERTGAKVSCPEEIAWRQGWISTDELTALAAEYPASGYGDYLQALANRAH